ncbi:hypothetical protein DUI87_21554 [Hirundo rustica rustica]|uniref:Uncharacterized protein n=1 Tax=Hirundo rustica rustica TaxID=333673 RepID=A0A3M0JTD8_HIRRU|nr:hypothetical protein DUI87_21554 [Hirundo rustica rustica]
MKLPSPNPSLKERKEKDRVDVEKTQHEVLPLLLLKLEPDMQIKETLEFWDPFRTKDSQNRKPEENPELKVVPLDWRRVICQSPNPPSSGVFLSSRGLPLELESSSKGIEWSSLEFPLWQGDLSIPHSSSSPGACLLSQGPPLELESSTKGVK